MKKIRNNTFETNSSSSHSLNIRKVLTFVDDGIFYPSILSHNCFNQYFNYIEASTTYEKLALYLHIIKASYNRLDDAEYNEYDIKILKEAYNDKITLILDNLCNHFNFFKIDFDFEPIFVHNWYDETEMPDYFDYLTWLQVIEDDSKSLVDYETFN